MKKTREVTQVSIEQTREAMTELLNGGQVPNVKLAFWNSALSLRTSLDRNCVWSRVMATYVDKPLPLDHTSLKDELNSYTAGIMDSHIETLYAIEKLYNEGILNFDAGDTLESQRMWRNNMVQIIPGMACKLISWALFIYNPMQTLLLTIDCHHARRLDINQSTIAGSEKVKCHNYELAEDRLLAECTELLPDENPVIVAAMIWLNYRNKGVTSHAGISCRWY